MITDSSDHTLPPLAGEAATHSRYAEATFAAFWAFNAITTFVFGYSYVYPLFSILFDALPISPTTQLLFARVTGGVAALIVLDIAYTRWHHIALHASDTHEQVSVALWAEKISFYLSLIYTGIVMMLTTFQNVLPPGLTTWVEWFAAITFVFVTCYHLIAWKKWRDHHPAVMSQLTQSKIQGLHLTQQLHFDETTMRKALGAATQVAQAQQPQLVSLLGHTWGENLINRVAAHNKPITPQAQQPHKEGETAHTDPHQFQPTRDPIHLNGHNHH